MSIKPLFLLLFILVAFVQAVAGTKPKELQLGECYVIRLTNGDELEGKVDSFISDPEEGDGIKFDSEIGIAKIYFSQISEIVQCSKYYRNGYKYFLLPTAIGIGNNHFVGMLEMFFLYGGIGITDYFSVIAGRSLLPGAYSNQQLSLINIKGSLPSIDFEDIPRNLYLAFGGNLGFANNNNKFIHFYGVATALFYKTSLSLSVFYKAGSEDYYLVRYGINSVDVNYPDGSFGVAFGVDTKIPHHKGLHFIAELWNIDVQRPTHSGLFMGIRLANTSVCFDFGLGWFTQPFVVPIANFSWSPF
jgi:hypothetical protein